MLVLAIYMINSLKRWSNY